MLRYAKGPGGKPLVSGKNVTGFTNTEEEAVHLTKLVPFLVENMLVRTGANYTKQADWQPYVVTDGLRITGPEPCVVGTGREGPAWAARLTSGA